MLKQWQLISKEDLKMYDTKKTTTEYKRWHREEDGTMVPDVTDYKKLQAWINTLDPRLKEEYEGKKEEN